MTGPVLEARDLTLRLGHRPVLQGVSLDLAAGDFAALLGLNGSGKTTLLRLLLGLAHADAGDIRLDGQPLSALGRREIARRMAYVPQAHTPSFPFTVREIVTMGRSPVAGWGSRRKSADDRAVEGALERLGLLAFAERSYAELSGGERQAVLIARALAQGAHILLMDEPTASLDLGQQTRLMTLLGGLAREGHAILVSIHQPELALRWFNRAILLHEGRVLGDGPPRATVTGDSLSRLYGIDARLIEADETLFLLAAISREGA
jgi:iron complex transport system ATP-binding protein